MVAETLRLSTMQHTRASLPSHHILLPFVLSFLYASTCIKCTTAFRLASLSSNRISSLAANVNNKSHISRIPIVICPGFGNASIDYLNPLNQGYDYSFVSALVNRGFHPELIQVLPLERYEWARVASGLLDPNFYTGNCRPDGLGYGWYVTRLRNTIEQMYQRAGNEKVLLIGHSAGGWLARAALADGAWESDKDQEMRASDRIRALITIGAIHKPPAGEAASTCVTRGVLAYLDETYPGAFLAKEGIAYISVGGDAVVGRQKSLLEDSEKGGSKRGNELYKVRGEGWASSVAFTAYQAVSGNGERTGDGVVPLEWSLLEGSRTIVLDGVFHSINEPGTTLPTDRWYGSEGVIDRWLPGALKEAGITISSSSEKLEPRVTDWINQAMSLVVQKYSQNIQVNDSLRRLIILFGPSLLFSSTGNTGNAAETVAESIRLITSNTIPGFGPPDVYYPSYFVGKWRVTRVVTSSDENFWKDVSLPIKIVSEMRFVPYNAGSKFEQNDGQSTNVPAIADRSFNERSYHNALISALNQSTFHEGDDSSKSLSFIQSLTWSPTNPNVLFITYADGSSKEIKVTKRSSDIDSDQNGVFSSEFRRITSIPPSLGNVAGGIPSVYKSRVLTKWKRPQASNTEINVDLIEGMEIIYMEEGTLGYKPQNRETLSTNSKNDLLSAVNENLLDWRSTKSKIFMERISS